MLRKFKPPHVFQAIGPLITKRGCTIINPNGTLIYEAHGVSDYLNIVFEDLNEGIEDYGMVVFFYDVNIAKNSRHAFYTQDIDLTYGYLPEGVYQFSLDTTEIKKLGPPYEKSNCTKNQTINDRGNSKYSYPACMDQCMAKRMKNKCGNVISLAEDYVDKVPQMLKGDQNKTIKCLNDFIDSSPFRNDCDCKESCERKVYAVNQRLVPKKSIYLNSWELKINFKSKMVNVIEEHPLYTATDLISNFGGLCGLFLGMLLLSLFEILFHGIITIAKYCM